MAAGAPKRDLLRGPVGPTLLRMAAPMMLGIASIMLFNIVDTIFVGQLGTKELAAMSYTLPVTFVVMSVAMGLGVGTTSVIARTIGEGDDDKVKRMATDGLVLALTVVGVVAFGGLLTIDPVFALAGAKPDEIELIRQYMTPWYLGVGLLVLPMVGNSAIRATGDTRSPAIIMMIAGVVNLGLDPLLIFGLGPFPRLGLQGAALATVISWSITFVCAFWLLAKREKMLLFAWPGFAVMLQSWRALLRIGLPASATNVLMPIAAFVLTRLVSGYGTEAVAAFGVGQRVESLAMIGVISMATAATPFVGQNYGARNCGRVREALRFAIRVNLFWGLGCALVMGVSAPFIASAFNDNPRVIEIASMYLWILPITYGALGVGALVNSVFNAVDKPLRSTTVIVLRLFVFILPLAFLGSAVFGLYGIFAGAALGNLLAGGAAYLLVKRFIEVTEEEMGSDTPIAEAPAE